MTDKQKLKIIDMDLHGRGIGKFDGKAVFVPSAVTGDVITFETVTAKKRYDIGKLCEIISPSKDRIVPECLSFGKCGGCVFMNIDYSLELEVKRRSVESAFRRAGLNIPVKRILSGGRNNYRNKVIFHLTDDRSYGFFSEGTHSGISCVDCLLIHSSFNRIISYSENFFSEHTEIAAPESIMLREGNGDVMLAAQTSSFGMSNLYLDSLIKEFPEIKSVYECNGYPGSYDTDFSLCYGDEHIQTSFGGILLNISPKSFFQVNNEIAEALCKEITSILSPAENDLILDLYCGIGTIGLTVAKAFPSVKILGIEINESAINDAKVNSKNSCIKNIDFVCSDAGRFDFGDLSPYAVIVDPPRYGLTYSMIKAILKISPQNLVYMSCDPGTLAGDTVKLISGGYSVVDCIAADMFPNSPHVETLITFKKND